MRSPSLNQERNAKKFMSKILLIMKLTAVLLIIFSLQLNAKTSAQTITYSGKNVGLKKIFNVIHEQTGYSFIYEERTLKTTNPVNIDFENVALKDALNLCFDKQGLKYEIKYNTIIITEDKKRAYNAYNSPPPQNIKGRVTDSKGQGIAGVSILVKDDNIGTSSNDSGYYSISIPTGKNILIFSFIGYVTQEIKIRSSASMQDVQLRLESKDLNEVVVVGYGTQKKVSLTNAVSSIKGDELTQRPVSNFPQALQGLAPGLSVLDQGGLPGRSSAVMRVRGVTTLNNNEALVIVDGVEQRLTDINPDDIESVSVLKDAASTAIYGSRAANGVLLVTTKRGKAGKVAVNYNGYYAIQKTINTGKMMDMESYMREQQVAYTNARSVVPSKFTDSSINVWVNSTDRYKYPLPNTWFSSLFSVAPQFNNTLAVSGGNENFKGRMSMRYMDQDGIIPNTEAKIREVRISTDFKAGNKFNFNADLNYRYNYSLSPYDVNNTVFDKITSGSLWAVPKYPNGTYGLSTQGNNPLMMAEIGGLNAQINDYLLGNLQGSWKIIDHLKFSTQFGVRLEFFSQKNFQNAFINTDSITKITKIIANNSLTETRNQLREYTFNNLLTYENIFDRHNIHALLGYSEIGDKQNNLFAYRERFYNNDLQSINQGANDGTKNNGGSEAEFGLRSFFGRLNYSFDQKYLFEANARYDGSSRFTGNNQYGFFPSFSGGWRLSQENFWNGLKNAISEFKLRGSWGKTGNQYVPLYSYYEALSPSTYTFGGTPAPAYAPTSLANKDITWETTTQTDVGLDMSLLRNLNISLDYYIKKTNGILLALPIPAAIGLDAPNQNAGVVDNKGFEITAAYSGGNRLRYNLNANFAVNNNKVISLAGTGPYISGDDINPRYIIAEGLPINAQWGYQTDGLFQTQEEIDKYPTYTSNTKPGDVKYVDRNGDGKITGDDMTMIGTSFPKYTYSLIGSLGYKKFELNFFFQGAAGVDVRLAGPLAEMGNNEGFVDKIYTNNYWTPEHTDARFPRPIKRDLRNVATSDRLMIDGSYIRLKNLQLLYNLPSALTKHLLMQKASVYISGTNLLTISKLNEWNFDPETQSGRLQYYPQTSLFTFGINVQF